MLSSTQLFSNITNEIKRRARLEYGDYDEMVVEDHNLDGTTRIVDLADDVIESTGLVVVLNGTPLAAGTDYVLDARGGRIALTSPPPPDSTLSVTGKNYQFYTDEELDDFLHSATLKHTHQRIVTGRSIDSSGFIAYSHMQQTIATLPEIERHPLAVFTAVEALWTLSSDATYDINVTTADGTDLPRMQRYQSIMNQIQALTDRYKDLCWQIGPVGFWRIHDGGKLRRTSLFTGRLVPLHAPRELDDSSFPARILTPIDVPVGTLDVANPIPCMTYNVVAQVGQDWSSEIEVDGGVDLTVSGTLVTASITAGSRTSSIVVIPVVVIDATHITLSLGRLVIGTLPPYAPWRVTLTYPSGNSTPVVSGTFLVEYPS